MSTRDGGHCVSGSFLGGVWLSGQKAHHRARARCPTSDPRERSISGELWGVTGFDGVSVSQDVPMRGLICDDVDRVGRTALSRVGSGGRHPTPADTSTWQVRN